MSDHPEGEAMTHPDITCLTCGRALTHGDRLCCPKPLTDAAAVPRTEPKEETR